MKTALEPTRALIDQVETGQEKPEWFKAAPAAYASRKIMQEITFSTGSFDDTKRTFRAVASTPLKDRQGDNIQQPGWELENFKNNPVIPWAHDYQQLPVARAIEVGVVDGVLQFTYQAPPKGLSEFADMVWDFYRNRFLFAFSVGFLPKDMAGDFSWEGNDYTKCELLEISAVVVPANPEALALAFSSGVIDKRQAQLYIDRLNDTAKSLKNTIAMSDELEETEEVAPQKEIEVEKSAIQEEKTLDIEKLVEQTVEKLLTKLQPQEEKSVRPGDYPIAPKDTAWDSGAAVKAVKAWASDSDGSIDFAKYSKCFMWCDDSSKDKQGGYKLPFADIIGEEPKAVWGAIKAIMGVLNGGRGGVNIPDADRKKVYAKVKSYYKKFDEVAPPLKSFFGLLTDLQSNEDNETMDTKANKDLGEGSNGGEALAPRPMNHKEIMDGLKAVSTVLDAHSKALHEHADVMHAHADTISLKADYLMKAADLLDHDGDEMSNDDDNDGDGKKPEAEKEDGVKNDADGDGIDDKHHLGDDKHAGQEIEEELKPNPALDRGSEKSVQDVIVKDAPVTLTKEADELTPEGEVKSEEKSDGADPEEGLIDPDNLTDEQVKALVEMVNKRLDDEESD